MALTNPSKYLGLLQQFKVEPNFWCSEEYFQKAALQERQEGDWVYIWDQAAEVTVLPPLNINMGAVPIRVDSDWAAKFWSDFKDYFPGSGYGPELLDLEYIYNPRHFLNMSGGSWAVFRKNSRKFPKRFGKELYYISSDFISEQMKREIIDLFKSWVDKSDEIHEAEVLFEYALNGENRKFLIDRDSNLFGVNAWDENYLRVNFRLCITRPGEQFLNEYMRLLFYTDEIILNSNKLVNDGGVLDSVELEKFKDKLNPLAVRHVKTWGRNE